MPLFGRNEEGVLSVGEEVPGPAPADTGTAADGPLLRVFDLEDEREYAVLGSRVSYVRAADSSDTGAAGVRTLVVVEDGDGTIELYTSTPPAEAVTAWKETLSRRD